MLAIRRSLWNTLPHIGWNCVSLLLLASSLSGWNAVASAQEQARADQQDRVVIQPGGRISTQMTLTGEIQDYTGERLTIQLRPGAPVNEYPTSEVLQVTTRHTPAHDRGLAQMKTRDWSRALMELQAGFQREERDWVRREILQAMVRCSLQQGDLLNAGGKFALLVRSDPQTRHWPLIPLAWTIGGPSNPALRQQADVWLGARDDEPAILLLGASWGLFEPQLQERALAKLKSLAVAADRRVMRLAVSQQWRTRVGQASTINPLEFRSWQTRLESLPEEYRAGPYYVVGRGLIGLREYELGAAHLLWLPLTADHDHQLAARACFEAGEALGEIGQFTPASALYREVTERYADTPFAPLAERELQALGQSANPSGELTTPAEK